MHLGDIDGLHKNVVFKHGWIARPYLGLEISVKGFLGDEGGTGGYKRVQAFNTVVLPPYT